MRVIIRRPHAYRFRERYKDTPIPGFVVLDGDGKFLGCVALPSKDAVEGVVKLLAK